MPGIKHLIQCHCVLPQYRSLASPLFHKFIVFSNVDEEDLVLPKLARCNNCDAIHKITDFCKSEIILGLEDTTAITTKDEIKPAIPEEIIEILDSHNCDLPTWEHCADILKNKLWNTEVVIAKENIGDATQFKVMKIKNRNDVKIETYLRSDVISV